MIKDFHLRPDQKTLKEILLHYRETVLTEIHSVKALWTLLMKGRQRKWTRDELQNIKTHFVRLSKRVPVLIIFLLPGGLVFLPVLIEVLDRRKKDSPVFRDRRKSR
jgi:hypothetical protein